MLVLFCQKCGSDAIDVNNWASEDSVIIKCYACQNESVLPNFTGGRVFNCTSKMILETFKDVAIHRGWSEEREDKFRKGQECSLFRSLWLYADDLPDSEKEKARIAFNEHEAPFGGV